MNRKNSNMQPSLVAHNTSQSWATHGTIYSCGRDFTWTIAHVPFLLFTQTRCWSQQYVFEAQFLTQWVGHYLCLLCLISTWSIGGDTLICFLSYRELVCKYIQDSTKITCAVCCSIKINEFSTLTFLRVANCWVNIGWLSCRWESLSLLPQWKRLMLCCE